MEKDKTVKFMFQSSAWHTNELRPVVLKQVFRQKDRGFVSLLDQMRRGCLDQFSISQLHYHVANPPMIFQPQPAHQPPSVLPAHSARSAPPSAACAPVVPPTLQSVAQHERDQQRDAGPSKRPPSQPSPPVAHGQADTSGGSSSAAAIIATSPFAAAAAAAGHGPTPQKEPVIDLTADGAAESPHAAAALPAAATGADGPGNRGGMVGSGAGGAGGAAEVPRITHNLSTRLFPRNEDAETANLERLQALAGTPDSSVLHHWLACDEGAAEPHLKHCIVQTRVSLRMGAQVRRPLLRREEEDAPRHASHIGSLHCDSSPLAYTRVCPLDPHPLCR